MYSAAHAVSVADAAALPTACTAMCCMLRALRTCLPCELCRVTYDAHMATCHVGQGEAGVYTRPDTLLSAERAARAAGRPHTDPATAYPALHCIVYVDSAVRRKLHTGDNGGTLRVARRIAALDGGYGSPHDVVYLLALMAAHATDGAAADVRAARSRATARFARAVAVLLCALPKYASMRHVMTACFPARLSVQDAEDADGVAARVCRVWCALHDERHDASGPVALELRRRVQLTRGKLTAVEALYAT